MTMNEWSSQRYNTTSFHSKPPELHDLLLGASPIITKKENQREKKTLTPQHNIFPPRNPITTTELGIGVEDLMNEEEEEEEEIILHLCHDRKQATHKTKNSKSVVSSFQSPFPSTSFPFLSFFPCLQRNPRNPNSPHSSCELF
jgi:hypothetical protein